RGGQKLAPVGRDDNVFLKLHAPIPLDRESDLERVNLRLLDRVVRALSVAIPSRSEYRTAIVTRSPHLVAEREVPRLGSVVLEHLPRGGVDFPSERPRPQGFRTSLYCSINDRERLSDFRRCLGFPVTQEVERP